MDKELIYGYYWGLLDERDRRKVEEFLRDAKNSREYADAAKSINTIAAIIGHDPNDSARIPFDAIRDAYLRRQSHARALRSLWIFGVISAIAVIGGFAGFYHIYIRERTTPPSEIPLVVRFIDNPAFHVNGRGETATITNAGVAIEPRSTLATETNGRLALQAGEGIVIDLEANSTFVFERIADSAEALTLSATLVRGSATVTGNSGAKPLSLRLKTARITASGDYRFLLRRDSTNDKQVKVVLDYGNIRVMR
jgi:hypothetical protein